MEISMSVDEVVAAFQRDWPHQYEITCLRLVNAAQRSRLAEFEAAAGRAGDEQPVG